MSKLVFVDIDTEYARDANLHAADVALLEEWQRKQPHLPAPLHPIETVLFLQSSRYSIEAAKRRIDSFYTFRTHCPEFFAHRDPLGPEVQLALNTCPMVVLPDLTPDGYLVNYIRIADCNPNIFNFNATIKTVDMLMNLAYKQRSYGNGCICIVDLHGFEIGHLLKTNVLSLKKSLAYIQTAVPVDIKSFHYVNAVPIMEKILSLVRPLLSKKFQDMLFVHYGDNSSIFKFVPRNILPTECGGEKFCAIEYFTNVTRKDLETNGDYFKQEEQQLADESKRPDKPTNLDNLFGVEGTFKKLNVD